MKLFSNKLKNNKGVTFVEVMIALVITGILTTSIMKLYVTQHRNYLVQDDITDMQQGVRASIDELGRNIRMAGYDLPLGLDAIEAHDTNPDTLVVTYHDNGCDSYLKFPMPQPSAELKMGTDIGCFYSGQWVFIYEPDSAKGEWFLITHVQDSARHIQHRTMSLSRKYGANAQVFAITRAKYYIDHTTDPDNPKLMRQLFGELPQVFAENITDLQLEYVTKSGIVEAEPALMSNLREVRINVTGQSGRPEINDAGDEVMRTRSFSTAIYLRNVGN